ncbi:hypothetical protein PCASD_21442 [Puccinia coronata f. sp. avenae]|uniref:Uncharacterized protein n=1 Tax=Puccinia coronata f. sp. avenae TaxID=200324 RepID=A0A2N5S0W4_9BASI|nr:hypothetical protein PCASD_21442 [Puccinia coronata f. sp. avenae]
MHCYQLSLESAQNIFDNRSRNNLMDLNLDSSPHIYLFKMIRASLITLAICLIFGQVPSFAYPSNLEARQGLADLQALKAAPVGRRNLPIFGLNSPPGAEQEQAGSGYGDYSDKPSGEPAKVDSSYGLDSYDPSQGSDIPLKNFFPSGNDKDGLGKGTYDLGTGTHHALQEGTYKSDGGDYNGSDQAASITPKPNASGGYGSEKSGYHSEPNKPVQSAKDKSYGTPSKSYGLGKGSSSKDPYGTSPENSQSRYNDSGAKNPGKYDEPVPKDKPKSSGETDYHKKKDPKNSGGYGSHSGGYGSPKGNQNGPNRTDKKSDEDGSFVLEEGTVEEQRKAAQEEAKKKGTYKQADPKGGDVKPISKSDYSSSNQSYGQSHAPSGQKDEDSSYV